MSSIGVDVGTSMVKAVRFSDAGEPEQTASLPATVLHPHPGWVEQDLEEVLALLVEVVREVAPPDGVVDVIALTAQGDGCWLVDGSGRPVRPAILWSDARAADIVDEWQRAGVLDAVFRRTGSYGNSGLATGILRWLAEHEADTLQRAETLLSCGSGLFQQLTGERVLHVSDACNPFLDARTGEYDDGLLAELGLGWVRRLFPPVEAGTAALAPLTSQAAAALGLRTGTTVALGPYDVVASVLGLGAVSRGRGFGILGTTLCVGGVVDDPLLDRAPSGMTLSPGWPGRWLLAYGTLAGTQVVEWARRLLGCEDAASLVRLAQTSTVAQPPLVLPYLSPAGERAPFRDAAARGTVLGLTLSHDAADVARGVLEGLSLTVRDCLEASGQTPSALALCGGGARSQAWCQLLADTTGVPVTRTDQDEVGARGAVLAGLTALGTYADIDAAAATVRAGERFDPDPTVTERLDAAYARFLAARELGAHRLA